MKFTWPEIHENSSSLKIYRQTIELKRCQKIYHKPIIFCSQISNKEIVLQNEINYTKYWDWRQLWLQITKLPLSFGDLKNLKWLDLKSNPLTAALSEIAGPCSDSEDCTKCARLVVDYYAKLRHMIDTNRTKEEKEKRIRDGKTNSFEQIHEKFFSAFNILL